MKRCPIGCGRVIGAGHLMCRAHWAKVPVSIQREVNRAWRAYDRDCHKPGADRISSPLLKPYLEARKAAIEAASGEQQLSL